MSTFNVSESANSTLKGLREMLILQWAATEPEETNTELHGSIRANEQKKKGLFWRHTSKWKKHFKLSHCGVTQSHTQSFLFIAKTQLLLFNIEELGLDESSPTQMFPRKPAGAFGGERETLQAKLLILVSKHGGSQNGARGPQLDLRDSAGGPQRLSTLQVDTIICS